MSLWHSQTTVSNQDNRHALQCVPKNSEMINFLHIFKIFIFLLHRNPDYWPEPQKFRPERFAEDAPPIDPYTYQPFIGGPYMCIGYKFAMMELKCVLALLLKEFRFSLPEDYKYVRRQRITMIPHPTLRVRMEKLN